MTYTKEFALANPEAKIATASGSITLIEFFERGCMDTKDGNEYFRDLNESRGVDEDGDEQVSGDFAVSLPSHLEFVEVV